MDAECLGGMDIGWVVINEDAVLARQFEPGEHCLIGS